MRKGGDGFEYWYAREGLPPPVSFYAVSAYEIVDRPSPGRWMVRIHSSTKAGIPIVRLYEVLDDGKKIYRVTAQGDIEGAWRRHGGSIGGDMEGRGRRGRPASGDHEAENRAMMLRDLFAGWEGAASLAHGILIVNGQPVRPDQAWFLRIVRATLEERQALIDAGYVLKDAGRPKFCRVLC